VKIAFLNKPREVILRWRAERCGLSLFKCPSHDPSALGYGLYAISDTRTGRQLTQGFKLTLEEAATFIDRKGRQDAS
jgi:hypothetical protein